MIYPVPKSSRGKSRIGGPLRGLLFALLFSVSLLLFKMSDPASLYSRSIDSVANSLAELYLSVLYSLANEDRAAKSVLPLKANPLLEKAAKNKAEDMAKRGYFSHTTPDGKDPWMFLDQVGYKYVFAGENLAVNFKDNSALEKAWMTSPKHRANLLNPDFKDYGIATSSGKYKGKQAVFVVALFGSLE